MKMGRKDIKKLLSKKRWCSQCQRAEDFIKLQPDDAIINVHLTGDFKYMSRKGRYNEVQE